MEASAPNGLRSVSALLFDLGGVVIGIDFARAFRRWAASAACDPDDLRTRFTFDRAYEEHERGRLDICEYFEALRQALRVNLSDRDLLAGWNDIYLGVVPGINALLSAAAERYPLYAFTNSNPTHKGIWGLRFARELSVFRTVFVSSELGVRKPDPDAFATVAGLIGLDPAAILFFDDDIENVEGAQRVGMPAVLVASTEDVRQALRRLGIHIGQASE
jgi:putative hydrolase of the HAD superfamily